MKNCCTREKDIVAIRRALYKLTLPIVPEAVTMVVTGFAALAMNSEVRVTFSLTAWLQPSIDIKHCEVGLDLGSGTVPNITRNLSVILIAVSTRYHKFLVAKPLILLGITGFCLWHW